MPLLFRDGDWEGLVAAATLRCVCKQLDAVGKAAIAKGEFKKLLCRSMPGPRLHGRALEAVAKASGGWLSHLSIGGVGTAAGPRGGRLKLGPALRAAPRLAVLDISGTDVRPGELVAALRAAAPTLEELHCVKCPGLAAADILEALLLSGRQLKVLECGKQVDAQRRLLDDEGFGSGGGGSGSSGGGSRGNLAGGIDLILPIMNRHAQ